MKRLFLAIFALWAGDASAALYTLDFTANRLGPVIDRGEAASTSIRQAFALDTLSGSVTFRLDAPTIDLFFGSDTAARGYDIEAFTLNEIDSPIETYPDVALSIEPGSSQLLVTQFGTNRTVFPDNEIISLRLDYLTPPADASLAALVAGPVFSGGQLFIATDLPGGSFAPEAFIFFDVDIASLRIAPVDPGAEIPLPAAAFLFAPALAFLRRRRGEAGAAPCLTH